MNDGNRLGALGILHALGLDPRGLEPSKVDRALPAGQHPILRWRLPDDVGEDPDALDAYPRAVLDGVARQLGKAERFRIELREVPGWSEAESLVRALATADLLRPRSVYLHYEPRVQPLIWQWPLRVGFLSDLASLHLRGLLANEQGDPNDPDNWRARTVQLLPPAELPSNCGLVLVPGVEEARARLDEVAARLRCGSVLILDWGLASTPLGASWERRLLDACWASGALVAAVDEPQSAELCFALFRQLTHNLTLDASLVEASRSLQLEYPVMTGSTALMRDSRLSRVMGRLTRSLESPRVRGVNLDLPSDSQAHHVFPMRGSLGELADAGRLFEIRENVWEHEGDYSVAMADLVRGVEAGMREDGVEAEPGSARFLQCQVTLPEAPRGSAPLTGYFRRGKPHRVAVRIGLPNGEWLQPSGNVPFPVEELPQELEEYSLDVVFSVLSGDGIPGEGATELPSKKIRLRREGGNSTTCAFDFDVPDAGEVFRARVLVLFGDRILQTGLLSGPVEARGDQEIRFEIEALVSRFFSGLRDGPKFRGTLLFNDNDDGETGVTGAAHGVVRISAPQGLAQQFDKLNKLVSAMAYDSETFTGKLDENADLLKQMIALARDGADVREVIEDSITAGSGFDAGKPIQVVSKAMGAKIPIEFFYDYRAPALEAKLCEGAAASLAAEDGACEQSHNRTVFCPSGFWGLNRVIEHHAFHAGSTQEDFELRNEPTVGRETISIARSALFGGTKVVDKALGEPEGLVKIKAQLDVLTDSRCRQVSDWDDWQVAVGSEAPSLLVLLVHTELGDPPGREQKLEIGDDQWLHYNDIYPEVVGGDADPGPLVFLIGCETGDAKISYKSLSEKFKRRGASLVVSSNATIHSRHAVPMLESFVATLKQKLGGSPVPFGEIAPRVRREMLAAGNPIVLCVTAYGDARWVLT